MPEMQKSELLALWLEGKLTPQQRETFEQACTEDSEFAAQVEAANGMLFAAEHHHPEPVPHWDRSATFGSAPGVEQRQPWWQPNWLPAASFATSLVAIVMVVSGFQVSVDNGRMTLAFAETPSQQQVEQLLEARLDEFQQNQQTALTSYAQALQQQQAETGAQLTKYLLTSSRQERKEDFAELIKFINEQRSDDQLFYARQLNKLQQDIYGNSPSSDWAPQSLPDTINE